MKGGGLAVMVELAVAERRAKFWASEVTRLESKFGIERPSARPDTDAALVDGCCPDPECGAAAETGMIHSSTVAVAIGEQSKRIRELESLLDTERRVSAKKDEQITDLIAARDRAQARTELPSSAQEYYDERRPTAADKPWPHGRDEG